MTKDVLLDRLVHNETANVIKPRNRRVSLSIIHSTSVISVDIAMNSQQLRHQEQSSEQEESNPQAHTIQKQRQLSIETTGEIKRPRRRRGLSLPLISMKPRSIAHRRYSRFGGASMHNGAEFYQEDDEEKVHQQRKDRARKRLSLVIKQVYSLIQVLRRMRMYAVEKGQHMRDVGTVISEKEEYYRDRKDLLFNQDDFKYEFQICIPSWAHEVCKQEPEERSKTDIQRLVHLMQSLKGFRKYCPEKQELLARCVRYESFGRRRVIIRKGHIGVSFYMIYSGSVAIVIHGDEDKAFLSNRDPEIILRRGDSFGEVALVKSVARSATVVCLQKTDFFVVDKEDFFKVGIDSFSKSEIEYREKSVRTMKLFETVSEAICKDIAEEGRVVHYLSDKVVEIDSSDSQFVYFITKGSCQVLRLLDLSKQWKNDRFKDLEVRKKVILPSSKCGKTIIAKGTKKRELPVNFSSGVSLPSVSGPTTKKHASKSLHASSSKKQTKSFSTTASKSTQQKDQENSEPFACLKVDELCPGETFGLCFLFQNDGIEENRKFSVVSEGCEIMRVPRTCIEGIEDQVVIDRLKNSVRWYPPDEALYARHLANDVWKRFRKEVVSNVIQKP